MYLGFRTGRHSFNHPLKWYRTVRKVIAKQQDLTEPELEQLIFLDDEYFTLARYQQSGLTLRWDRARLKRLIAEGWLEEYRPFKPPSQAALYKSTGKAHHLVKRIYRILEEKEDLPTSVRRNKIMKADDKLSYSDKMLKQATLLMQDDRFKNRYNND